jgi:biopolymer transport protein ExbB/TolQ
VCSRANAPLSRIIKAGLLKANRPDDEVQAAMDEAALRELPKLEKRTGYLGLMANMAMLSGLLGTVAGLITAFHAVAGVDAATRATVLADGISEAMSCTAFGLFSSMIALLGFGVLNGKTQTLLDEINASTVQVVNLVVNNRSKIRLTAA